MTTGTSTTSLHFHRRLTSFSRLRIFRFFLVLYYYLTFGVNGTSARHEKKNQLELSTMLNA